MKRLAAGESGFSSIDGHPFTVADADAWMRSSNKNYVRKIAMQMYRRAGNGGYDPSLLRRLATRVPKTTR